MLVDVSRHPRTAIGASALVGTVALTLLSSPAQAAEPSSLRSAAPRPAQPVVPAQHTVAVGESVSAIAARYGLATADLLAWNGLSWSDSLIRPGDALRLHAPAAPAAATPAPASAAVHTVVAGDTVSAIAARHGSSAAAVLAVNGLTWDSIIYPGQSLQLPGAASSAATASACSSR